MPEQVQISDAFAQHLRQIGFTPQMVFQSDQIKPWRKLPDRENCTWDLNIAGRPARWHVKRFPSNRANDDWAKLEASGFGLLRQQQIPTASVVAWATLADGRGFIITEDLVGHLPSDKLIESGFPFEKLLLPTAELAARLHGANLHHRDLYLCHFLARQDQFDLDLRLIDAARVAQLPRFPFRRRWIVKDLAQFWFSTLSLPITDAQRENWLEHYSELAKIDDMVSLRRAILRKSRSIAVHDRNLRKDQPHRNISIPR